MSAGSGGAMPSRSIGSDEEERSRGRARRQGAALGQKKQSTAMRFCSPWLGQDEIVHVPRPPCSRLTYALSTPDGDRTTDDGRQCGGTSGESMQCRQRPPALPSSANATLDAIDHDVNIIIIPNCPTYNFVGQESHHSTPRQ